MKRFTLLVFFLSVGLGKGVLAQSSVTVGMGPTPQTVDLGMYGDTHLTQVTLVCMTSATRYYWAIDAPWQTTTGKTNSFFTTTNTITIVPIPGFAGCGGGSVGVSNTLGGSLLTMAEKNASVGRVATTQTTFSYIVGLNQTDAYINIDLVGRAGQDDDVAILGTDLANFSPGVSFSSWSLTDNSSPNYLFYFQSAGNQQGLMYVMPGASYSTTYTATVNTMASVSGSSGCGRNVTRYLVVRPAVEPTPGEPSVCYTLYEENVEEVRCDTFSEGISRPSARASIYPNPSTSAFEVDLRGGSASEISLYTGDGVLVGSKENVKDKTTWDTSSLQKGIYLIKIVSGNESTTKRLVIK